MKQIIRDTKRAMLVLVSLISVQVGTTFAAELEIDQAEALKTRLLETLSLDKTQQPAELEKLSLEAWALYSKFDAAGISAEKRFTMDNCIKFIAVRQERLMSNRDEQMADPNVKLKFLSSDEI